MKFTIVLDARAVAARRLATDKRDAMRDGVVLKAQTHRARKGKGSYSRTTKHKGDIG